MKVAKNKKSEQFLNIKNFIPYTPEPDEALFAGAAHLKSEDGQDWYACQQLFSEDTLKITYDDNDVITCITRDISGGWQFKEGKVVQRVYSPEELRKKAEAEKVRRLAEAESAIAPLARAVKLKIATDEEIKRLEAWELYSVMVNRLDTASPDWPEKPASH